MTVYATPADYAAWADDGPAEADLERYLRSASRLVGRVTRAAVYDVDAAGKPVAGTDAADALRDATCAQVEAWHGQGVDPLLGRVGGKAQAVSKTINGASVQYAVYAAQAEARADAATTLCDESYSILVDAGLVGSAAHTGG